MGASHPPGNKWITLIFFFWGEDNICLFVFSDINCYWFWFSFYVQYASESTAIHRLIEYFIHHHEILHSTSSNQRICFKKTQKTKAIGTCCMNYNSLLFMDSKSWRIGLLRILLWHQLRGITPPNFLASFVCWVQEVILAKPWVNVYILFHLLKLPFVTLEEHS